MNVKNDSDIMDFVTMEKYYNDIIDNMRINLKTAEERIKRLQHSEFKLEADIEDLKYKLNQIKKIINESNHTLSGKQETIPGFLLEH